MKSILKKDEFYDLTELLAEINRNELGVSFEYIYTYFKTAEITVTEEQIKGFLALCAEADGVDLELKQKKVSNRNRYLTTEEIEEDANNFLNRLQMTKYSYNSKQLEYFYKYTSILRGKALRFCLLVVSMLDGKPLEELEKILPDFEKAINIQAGKIDGDSIQRLAKVILNNYADMKRKMDDANRLGTYFHLPADINLHSLNRDGINEDELYPVYKLQPDNIYDENWDNSCLELSPRQYNELQKKVWEQWGIVRETIEKHVKILT